MYVSIQNQNITKWLNKVAIVAEAVAINTCMIAPVHTNNAMDNTVIASCIPMNSVLWDFVALNASNLKISFSPKNSKTIPPMAASVKISSALKCTAAVIDKVKNVILNYVSAKAAKTIQMDSSIEKRRKFSFKFANNNRLKDKIFIFTHSVKTKNRLIPQLTLS
jgi:hypothetical protein